MNDLFKHCWQKRWIRGLAWTAVSFVTLFVLLYMWVNWSGARSWRATLAALEAEGETADFRQICSDPIPAEDNYCAIPLLADLPLAVEGSNGAPEQNRTTLEAMKLPDWDGRGKRPTRLAEAMLGKPYDLEPWAALLRRTIGANDPGSGNAAKEVLAALGKNDAVVRELAQGLSRSQSQWTPAMKTRNLPVPIVTIRCPQYGVERHVVQMFALRSIAAAREGDAAKAHESAEIVLRLAQASLDDPFLIGELVGAADLSMLHRITWELIYGHTGTAEEFAKLETGFARFDLHGAILKGFRGELASAVDAVQFMKRSRQDLWMLFANDAMQQSGRPTFFERFLAEAIPSGVFDSECAALVDENIRSFVQPARNPAWKALLQSTSDCENRISAMKTHLWMHPSKILLGMAMPAMHTFTVRAIFTQALVDQCVVACALERFRIEKGDYPETLDSVKRIDGSPLPLDLVSGEPMHYHKTPNGRYALWSVGFDGKDDQGKRTLNLKNPEATRFNDVNYVGDWVWDFPE